MRFYEYWKLNTSAEVKKNTERELWKMKNDDAYIKQSYDEISELFDQSDIFEKDGRLDITEIDKFIFRTDMILIAKEIWLDNNLKLPETLYELCNSINPRLEGCTLDEILAPMQLMTDAFYEILEEDKI